MSLESIYRDGRYYDLEFRNWNADIPYYTSIVKERPGSVLELACGTGRITVPLARLGVPVTGLELLDTMLSQARHNGASAGIQIDWIQGDMANFKLHKKFDWVLLPFNSMQHLHDSTLVQAMLGCIRNHLTPSGRFAFDVLNPIFPNLSHEFSPFIEADHFDDPDGKGGVKIAVSHSYDRTSMIKKTMLRYSIDGEEAQRFEEIRMRCYDPDHLSTLLRENGFEIEHRFGSYDRIPFSSQTKQQLYVCKVT